MYRTTIAPAASADTTAFAGSAALLGYSVNVQSEPAAPAVRSGGRRPSLASAKCSQRRLSRVLEFIDNHCDRPLSVETLAEVACLSKSHFARFFKAATGMSPHRYISEKRVDHAKHLLEDHKRPVLNVALVCHFSSHANFCKTFRRVTGMTPGQYRAAVMVRASAERAQGDQAPLASPEARRIQPIAFVGGEANRAWSAF